MGTLRIGDLSRQTETKVETIRWYEKVGLLPAPARTGGNYRLYGEAELTRLSFIRRARDLGFSLDQVRTLLDLSSNATAACDTVHQSASGHIAEIDRKIADLSALRRELTALVASCKGGRVGECQILEAFAPLNKSSNSVPASRSNPTENAPLPQG